MGLSVQKHFIGLTSLEMKTTHSFPRFMRDIGGVFNQDPTKLLRIIIILKLGTQTINIFLLTNQYRLASF